MSRGRRGGRTGGAVRDRVVQALAAPVRRLLAPLVRDVVAAEADRVISALHEVEFRQRRDLLAAGERDAAVRSARFAAQEMPTARAFHDRTSTLEHGLELAPRGGMALEFGVFEGRSLEVVAAGRGRREVYGFDSFEGLPEDYRPHVRTGAFAVGSLPDVEGAELVVGWFGETLPGFLATHPGPVDFVHVDGDLYSSAVTVLDLVGPRLTAGSVLVFDEFFNFPGWEAHEFRAWQEWLARTGARAEYVAYTSNDEQVVVRLTEPGHAPAG
ncbi:class I SAM-dependent methyltransferase [Blastococcus sp. BMG 814]|uniref:Class I SAM-dependent methyltransferase n=1 Tax=Blastococcus carthaginiensis TaxID=3050034 RepID=A0ABT9IB34_9ACTN|nr:class I SAM-dependent methyltransferase [Blastococcus carthaginiensis]MDP5182780.1 class I SAM-dependent methyltransferase [Blastococcus carthaginiensis]